MNSLNILFLVLTSMLTLCVVFIPRFISNKFMHYVIFIIILGIFQYLFDGYFWQYIPTYVLLLTLIILLLYTKRNGNILQGKFLRIILSLILFFSILPWILFNPIPKLTKPRGGFEVGTRIFRWVDIDREELITKNRNDKRNVVVQAFYPTQINEMAVYSQYMDGLDSLTSEIGIIPNLLFKKYDKIHTYGALNAPISKVKKQWLVIIFLTGYGSTRSVYTSLSAGLASYGFVVLTIDHPYEAAITKLSNGEIVTAIEDFSKDDSYRFKFMKNRLDIRVSDVQFVLNQIDEENSKFDSFFSSLDPNRIATAGHSLGGASAAVAMTHDSRIKAAANIDGTLYGKLPRSSGKHHFLLLESNKSDIGLYERYEKGNQLLFKQFQGGYRYEIIGADHYSFTDVPYFLAPPARMLAGMILKLVQSPKDTHNATVDILTSFFNNSLNNKEPDIYSAVNRYPNIKRKAVK